MMLEPCPFCGASGELGTHAEIDTLHFAGCSEPDCIGHMIAYDFITQEAAGAAWNKRAVEN